MTRIRFHLQPNAIATAVLSAIAIVGSVPAINLPFGAIATAQTPALSTLERQVWAEMNRVRTDPQGYANWLAQMKQYYQGRILNLPNQDALPTQEGIVAVDDAIAALQNLSPLPPLTLSPGMSLGAQDHVNDLGSQGNIGHYGSDGSQFLERIARYGESQGAVAENLTYGVTSAEAIVMQMIVDDGIAERYHRNNILSPEFSTTGVACGDHPRYQQMCVVTYSQDFRDRLATNPTVDTNEIPSAVVVTAPPPNPPTVPEPQNPATIPDIPANTNNETPETPSVAVVTVPPPSPATVPEPQNTAATQPTDPLPETTVTPPPEANTEPTAINPPPATPREILNEQGILEEGDEVYERDGSLYDVHQFSGEAGQVLTISVESNEFDTFLAVFDDNDTIIDQNDDLSDTDTNSLVQITLPRDGTYRIFINGYDEDDRGRYQIMVEED